MISRILTGRKRENIQLPEGVNKRLAAYALAATAGCPSLEHSAYSHSVLPG